LTFAGHLGYVRPMAQHTTETTPLPA